MARKKKDSSDESSSEEESNNSDSGSESEDSSEESGSDSSSESGSSDSEEDSSSDEGEEDKVGKILKNAGMKKYVKAFEKNKINDMKALYRLDDKQLRSKLGIEDSGDRKKILAAIKNSRKAGSDSSSDDDSSGASSDASSDGSSSSGSSSSGSSSSSQNEVDTIRKVLRDAGLKEYFTTLRKNADVQDLDDCYRLKDKYLKRAGIESLAARKRIIKAFQKHRAKHEDSSDSDVQNLSVIYKLLSKKGLRKYYQALKQHKVVTVAKAKKLEHKDLREMGVVLYKDRRDIIEAFRDYKGEDLTSSSSESVSGSTGTSSEENVNVVEEVLRACQLSKHIPDFERMNITTLRQARALTHTQLRSMGVPLYLQREKLINAFREYKPENKSIMRILQKTNLLRYRHEFARLIDVEDCKKLTHSDLRAMGISLYGQRERLMRAFGEYKPSKERREEKKKMRKQMKALRRNRSSSGSSSASSISAVEQVLAQQDLKRYIPQFKNVRNLQQASNLTHSQLRNKGITLFGSRDRLLRAFAEAHKEREKEKARRKKKSKSSKKSKN